MLFNSVRPFDNHSFCDIRVFSRSYEVKKFWIWWKWPHTRECTKYLASGFPCISMLILWRTFLESFMVFLTIFHEVMKLFQPSFQGRINVVSTLWINVEITLIRRWKWNKIRRRIFNVAQRWYNVSVRRWNNIETTLHNVGTTLIKRCFNRASTLVKAILNLIGLLMIVDCEIVEYTLNTWIVFILLNEKIFYYILTIQLLMKYQKNFLTVVLIVIHNVEAVVQKRSIKKVFLEIS